MTASKKSLVALGVAAAALSCVASAAVAWKLRSDREWQVGVLRQDVLRIRREADEQAAEKPVEIAPAGPSWRLLGGPESVETLGYLQEVADGCGIVFDLQQALRSSQVGRQTFLLKGRASADQFAEFLVAVEAGDRLIVIENGRVLPSDGDLVAFEMGVATYDVGGVR